MAICFQSEGGVLGLRRTVRNIVQKENLREQPVDPSKETT